MSPDSTPLTPSAALEHKHTKAAIRERIAGSTNHSYLGDFVLGAVDGTVTTFAVVSGAAGAGFSSTVALVLGIANLLADGFSMAISNYLNVQSNRQFIDSVRSMEERHIDLVPEGEREEIRQIFLAKGFDGELLEQLVDVLTQDRRRWVDTMITEEFGLPIETPSPGKAGVATFAAFLLAGWVPLIPLVVPGLEPVTMFTASTIATVVTFFLIGLAKGYVVYRPVIRSGLETLGVGAIAAALAFIVGWLLRGLGGQM